MLRRIRIPQLLTEMICRNAQKTIMEYKSDNNKNVFSENKAFLIPCLALWTAGAVILAIYDKVSVQIWVNGFYSAWQNDIWIAATDMGDTFFFLAVFFVGSLLSYRFSLYLSATGIAMVAASTLLKYLFGHPRPLTVLAEMNLLENISTVPGYAMKCCNSFPSGHTATAFALFCTCALFLRNRVLKFTAFALALAVGYSRIYLMQHFFEDVYAGSIIGVLVAVAAYCLLSKARWVNNLKFISTSPLRQIKSRFLH